MIDSEALVKALGLRVHRMTDTEINCFCPLHKDGKERNPSFSISRKKEFFNCLACGGGSIAWLVHKITGRTVAESVEYLVQFGGTKLRKTGFKEYEDRFHQEVSIVPESILAPFVRVPRMVAIRLGFLPTLLHKEGVLFDKYEDRVIFVARDTDGHIRGVVGRSMHGEEPKYLFYAGSRRRSVLGIDTCGQSSRLIVVEGPRDWLRLRHYGFKNSVALLGCHASEEQAAIISGQAKLVVALLDNDSAGRHGTEKLQERFEDCPVRGVDWKKSDPKDPGDIRDAKRLRELTSVSLLQVKRRRFHVPVQAQEEKEYV